MPRRRLDVVDVVLTFLSGEQLVCRMTHSQAIISVKSWIKSELNIRKWRIILLQNGAICRDDALLSDFTDYEPLPEFSILSDIVPAATFMPAKPLHLQVVLKDAITTCAGCAQEGCGYQRCSQCLRAWYCSVECQRRAWPDHKHICSRHSWEQGCHELPA